MKLRTGRVWMLFVVGSIAMWFCAAGLFYALVQPLKWQNASSTPTLDVAALLDAISLAALFHIACWLVLFPLMRKNHLTMAAFVSFVVTWLVSATIFTLMDGKDFTDHIPVIGRAAGTMANGGDLVFMPFLIPVLSTVSGAIFGGMILAYEQTKTE